MFPEGWAYIGNCPMCDDPVINVYIGRKFRLHTWSVRFADAKVLSRYLGLVYNVWPDVHTQTLKSSPGHPVRFYARLWDYSLPKPSNGRLYVHHICGILGRWSDFRWKGNRQ